ncbi:MAG: hypothetical protein ACTSU2_04070 [Promethearchaeota archaeon]
MSESKKDLNTNIAISLQGQSLSALSYFLIIFMDQVYFLQALREILIDRAIIIVIGSLLISALLSGISTALLLKKISNYIMIIISGTFGALGRILLSIPDISFNEANYNYPIYNTGLYLIFVSFPMAIITLFGMLNVDFAKKRINNRNLKEEKSQNGGFDNVDNVDNVANVETITIVLAFSFGFILSFIYNWWSRITGLAENMILNILLGAFGLVLFFILLTSGIYKIKNELDRDLKNLERSAGIKKIILIFTTREPRESLLEDTSFNHNKDDDNDNEGKKHLSVIAILLPLFLFLYLSFSYPALYAYMAGIPYPQIHIIFILGMLAGSITALYVLLGEYMEKGCENNNNSQMSKTIRSKNIILKSYPVISLISVIFFGLLSFFPAGNKSYTIIYFFMAYVVAFGVIYTINIVINYQSKDIEKAVLILVIFFIIGYFVLKLLSTERYIPFLEEIIGLTFAIPTFLIYRKKGRNKGRSGGHDKKKVSISDIIPKNTLNKAKIFALLFIVLFTLPIISIEFQNMDLSGASGAPSSSTSNPEKTVWASLYTWYGVPGQPAGMFRYPEWQKNASLNLSDYYNYKKPYRNVLEKYMLERMENGFNYSLSSMHNLSYAHKPDTFQLNGSADGSGKTLILSFNYTRIAYSRMYLEFNLSADNYTFDNGKFSIEIYGRSWNKAENSYNYYLINKSIDLSKYQAITIDSEHRYYIIDEVMYILQNKTKVDWAPGNVVVIKYTSDKSGNYSMGINYFQGSAWSHYDEDYHTYADADGYYFNDPPVHLATAHHAFYNGTPWPDIPKYGTYNHSRWHEFPSDNQIYYGIYDSLNETVIASQLMLMEKAGIDVVQIMHPWDVIVARYIMDIAGSINSNLTFSYYTGRSISEVARIMEYLASDPRFYKINDRAVITWGFTGGLNEPYSVFYRKIEELKRTYNVYLVADLYSNRFLAKEELLYSYDCWYYYDTSAFYRQGYGDPRIKNYQGDGKLYPMSAWGHLDKIFGSLSTLAHGHNREYCAIIIPGTDNTAVHGFIGSEMYDGRTGTINTRSGGLTFNLTWQAAIKARADFIDIVSWNELHEGTEIEPTIENGTQYVEWNAYWAAIFKSD